MSDPVEKPTRRTRALLQLIAPRELPVDLRLLGRTLLHAALVGAAAGAIGAAFFAGLEYAQRFLLEDLAGYQPLRARGETFIGAHLPHPFRWWTLLILPALGGLACGLIAQLAPETQGGGGDAMIDAYHRHGGFVRRRVLWVKAIASIFTLGSGGAGGREGPTMQIGGALGALVARTLRLDARERRILLVAGVAAGIAAVFRTPLGAALLAVEVLYRDDFESDALVPAVLAAVVAYSVVILLFGETTLFADFGRMPFVPAHLPLYGALAVLLAPLALLFLQTLGLVKRLADRLPGPRFLRPAAGGLLLGLFATPIIYEVGKRIGSPGQGLGILGGGYGAVQMAIAGSPWLTEGWHAVELLALLCLVKVVAASLTIGSGGSAGDFAPSLAIGGIFGGAFGRAAQLVLHDPRIQPGAFALVGMGAFYGGISHAPLSSLVLVCELAGSYDLLVPLMLAEAITFVLLRNRSLYHAQPATKRDSPVHGDELPAPPVRVSEVMLREGAYEKFARDTPASELVRRASEAAWQDAFPVLDSDGRMLGMVTADALRLVAGEPEAMRWTIAADLMQPAVTVRPDTDVAEAARLMVAHALREIPVVDEGLIVGFLDQADIAKVYLRAADKQEGRAGA